MRRFLRFRTASAVSSTYSIEGGRTIGRFHIRSTAKRRGGILPARLRFSAHRGVTLIELMISMLILTLVCTAWLEIIGIQSAKKEAYRREAVERLAGMMDAFIDFNKTNNIDRIKAKSYIVQIGLNDFSITDSSSETSINQVFSNDEPPIGYRLRVVGSSSNKINGWNKKWLIGELYNKTGTLMPSDKPFFSLPICLW